jgi:hypothetical protein
MKKIAFIFVLLALSISSASFGFDENLIFAENSRVSIEVNAKEPGIRIPSNFTGFSYETSLIRNEIAGGNNSTLIRLYRNLGTGVIRIGGGSLDRITLNEGAEASIDQLISFSKASGWTLIFGLPLGQYNSSNAAMLAEYVLRNAGSQLLAFEVGNEPDLFSRNGIRSKSYSFSDYLVEFNSYYYEVKEYVPSAPFVGPDIASLPNKWLEPFAGNESSRVVFLTVHFYALGPAGSPSVTIPNLLSSKTTKRLMRAISSLETIEKKFNISVRIDETNSVYNGGQDGVSDVFASSLWAVDYMFTLASNGIIGVNFHNPPANRYAAITLSGTEYLARPLYYGMLLFRIASQGRFLPLKQEGSSINLDSYAVLQDDGTIVVTLVNKERERSVDIEISAGDDNASYTATSVWLRAPSLESKTGITLGGDEVSGTGAWEILRPNEIQVCRDNGNFELTLPAASAIAIFLTTPTSPLKGDYWGTPLARNSSMNSCTFKSLAEWIEENNQPLFGAVLVGCFGLSIITLHRIRRKRKT